MIHLKSPMGPRMIGVYRRKLYSRGPIAANRKPPHHRGQIPHNPPWTPSSARREMRQISRTHSHCPPPLPLPRLRRPPSGLTGKRESVRLTNCEGAAAISRANSVDCQNLKMAFFLREGDLAMPKNAL